MAAELRFILAALSALLLAGIWWWGARRSRQAAGNAVLRESTMSSSTTPVRTAPPVDDEPNPTEPPGSHDGSREWGVSPLEPLSIRTAQFESAQLTDLPMTAHADPLDETLDLGIADHEHAAHQFAPPPPERADGRVSVGARGTEPMPARGAEPVPASGAESVPAAPKPQLANASETQRIVSIRVCAAGETRW